MAQGRERKDLSIKACPRQHIYCCSLEGLADPKGTNRQTEQMKRSSALWKAQGLSRQIFHSRLSLPLCLPSLPWAQLTRDGGQEDKFQLWHPQSHRPSATRNGMLGSKASWELVEKISKRVLGQFSTSALQSCVCSLGSACRAQQCPGVCSPQPLQGAGQAAVQTCLAELLQPASTPEQPPNIPANTGTQSYWEQTWGQMSRIKRKMPVVDKRNDSWKWCFQGSFILGTGKMQ